MTVTTRSSEDDAGGADAATGESAATAAGAAAAAAAGVPAGEASGQSVAQTAAVTAGTSEPAPAGIGGVSLLGSASLASTRCENCAAPMADDQRYCVECGTRRGVPRFSLAPGASAPAGSTSSSAGSSRRTFSPVTMVILGTVVILLALGVGFLIGNATSSTPPVHVYLNGSGAASSTGGSGSSSAASGGGGSSSSSGGSGKSSGSGSGTSSPKVGGSCTNGTAGCKNGKFTGNFFGS